MSYRQVLSATGRGTCATFDVPFNIPRSGAQQQYHNPNQYIPDINIERSNGEKTEAPAQLTDDVTHAQDDLTFDNTLMAMLLTTELIVEQVTTYNGVQVDYIAQQDVDSQYNLNHLTGKLAVAI